MRNDTENIYKQKINQVLDHITMNLEKPLAFSLAGLICVSQRQFIRIMRSALDESVSSHTLRYGLTFEEYLNSPLDTEEENLITNIFMPIK